MARLSFENLVNRAGTIVDCTVVSQESRRDDDDLIRTYITLRIHEYIVGTNDASTITIRHPGGTVEDESIIVDGMPKLSVGQRYILFLRRSLRGICPILGWRQGCFHVTSGSDEPTHRVTTNSNESIRGVAVGRLITGNTDTPSKQRSMAVTQFKSIIRNMRERPAHRTVEIESP